MSTNIIQFNSARFKALRKRKGLTLQQIADDMGLSKTTVHQWESQKSLPTPENLSKLANYFEIEVAEIASPLPGGKSANKRELENVSHGNFPVSEKISSIFKMIAAQRGQSLDELLYPIALELAKRVLESPEITDEDLLEDARDILR